MKKIIFFPQNETHIDNMLPIACQLADSFEVVFIDAGKYFCQPIYPEKFPFTIGVFSPKLPLKKSFYFLGVLEKWSLVKEFSKQLKKRLRKEVDCIVVGNDGALQRSLLKLYPTSRHVLILDGIISDYSYPFVNVFRYSTELYKDLKDCARIKIKQSLSTVMHRLPFNEFLPSELGNHNFDAAFVISEYVENVLKNRKSPIKKYFSYGLPRYHWMLDSERVVDDKSCKRILFITDAYLWHNDKVGDRYQHCELKRFLSLANDVDPVGNKINVVIRVHPRDEVEKYRCYQAQIEDSSVELRDSMLKSDLVVGFNSTVLLESGWYKIPTISVMTCGQDWKFSRSFLSLGIIPMLKSENDVKRVLQDFLNNELNLSESSGINWLFDPISQDTVGRISEVIREL